VKNHLVDHFRHHELQSDNTMYVVGVCSNPARWHSRYRIGREWIKAMVGTKNVHLTIVEAAIGDRHHELTPDNGEYDHVTLRVNHETWIKESMANLGHRHDVVKYGAKYLALIDMDVFFRDDGWAQEAMHQLQTFEVIQPWQDCADLGPHGGISRHFRSFGYQHQRGVKKQTHPGQPYEYAHTGFAWCYRREFWEQVQGLMDFAILGSADHHQAFAMIGEVDKTIHRGMAASFFELCHEWQDRAMALTHGEVGFAVGRIEHWFHGPKNRRYYRERWQILVDHLFDPKKHLMRDSQGIVYIVGNKKLEHAIIKYNRSRFEDDISEF
jgi:hypothetical protein